MSGNLRIVKTTGTAEAALVYQILVTTVGLAPPDFEGTLDALMDAIELHEKKARDYDGMENEYGLKGEVIGLSRKMGKIKKIFWDGKDPIFEGGQEILMDLIGSAALMLRMQKKVKDKYLAEWRSPVTSDRPDFPQSYGL